MTEHAKHEPVAILQTGRLGDLWFTLPLAWQLRQQGSEVEIWYDASFGNPFKYMPYVVPRPVRLPFSVNRINRRPWDFAKEAFNQMQLYAWLRMRRSRVIWNELYPLRLPRVIRRKIPYPVQWYERHPGVSFRRAPMTLPCRNDRTILLVKRSTSLFFQRGPAFDAWIDENLRSLAAATGYSPIHVTHAEEEPHPGCRSCRADFDEYQHLIAGAGIVFGVSTSAHVLGQLLGKPVVSLYPDPGMRYIKIGDETAQLHPYEILSSAQIEGILEACAKVER
jgi:hypothetical protein